MSKPDINCLGIASELTLHEKALRKAQAEIDALKSECAMWRSQNEALRKELAVLKAPPTPTTDRILCGEPCSLSQMAEALRETYGGKEILAHTHQFPPHHSTLGTPHDVQG